MGTYKNHKTFDLACLRTISGGDGVFERDLLQLVIRDLDDGIDNLQFAWHRNDMVEISKMTHLLKSLSAVTGLHDLSGLIMMIEQQIKSGIFRTHSEEMLVQILANWHEVRPALHQALSAYR